MTEVEMDLCRQIAICRNMVLHLWSITECLEFLQKNSFYPVIFYNFARLEWTSGDLKDCAHPRYASGKTPLEAILRLILWILKGRKNDV